VTPLAEGKSDVPNLDQRHFLTHSEHPRTDCETRSWFDHQVCTTKGKTTAWYCERVGLTKRRFKASVFYPGATATSSTATPWRCPQTQLVHPQNPKSSAAKTAVVTGPEGEEIHCDHGRIKVAVSTGSRKASANDQTSCWLRSLLQLGPANQLRRHRHPQESAWKSLITFSEGRPGDQPLGHRLPAPQDPSGTLSKLPTHKNPQLYFKTLTPPHGGVPAVA